MGAAFAYTRSTEIEVIGKKRRFRGTYTSSGGATGGDIVTGLSFVTGFNTTPTGAAVSGDATAVNETVATDTIIVGGTVTIVSTANETGIWVAEGFL
jgi:hypothetical protein